MKVLIAGDFASTGRVKSQIDEGNYTCFENIKPVIKSVDYAIVNFECPVLTREAEPIKKSGPNLFCSYRAVECLVEAGFKCVTLANNHFRDFGQIGVEDSISAFKKYGLDYVGGGIDLMEAERVLYKDVAGSTIAIVNICENEWSIASEDYGGSASLNPVRNFYVLQEAKQRADFVIVIVHGGVEHYQYPTSRMVDTYRFFIDAGADAVINHHQHCFSGYEVYHDKPIFYGLGNFCFDSLTKRDSKWNDGYMVILKMFNSSVQFDIIPYCQCGESPTVDFMDAIKLNKFNEKLKQINMIVSDPQAIELQLNSYIDKHNSSYMFSLEPIRNKYFRKLQRIGLLPRLMKDLTLRSWYDRMKCESHRDVICQVMKRNIENSEPQL